MAAQPADFAADVRPLLQKYCFDCHAADLTEADVDLGPFQTLEDLRRNPKLWVKVRNILESGQMPPPDSPQPTDDELRQIRGWVREFLLDEARATAGDPGVIILRRLNNEEYNYTIADLTGVSSLNPTREFPVDGAAGEGFINTGAAQGMSPAMVVKYLEAANEVATHVMLLPDGLRFSPHTTRRDQTDELLARIQSFYRQFTDDGGGSAVNLQGIQFTTNQGGLLPLEKYLAATIQEREALQAGRTSIEQVAEQRKLNAKYLGILWQALAGTTGTEPGFALRHLRQQWRSATEANLPALVTEIRQAQQHLWKYNAVGQLQAGGQQKIWMEPVTPIVTQQALQQELKPTTAATDSRLYLVAHDLGDQLAKPYVVWQQPRIEFAPDENGTTHPPILWRDIEQYTPAVRKIVSRELPRTAQYLAALERSYRNGTELVDEARTRGLNLELLQNWAKVVELNVASARDIQGHLTAKITQAQGYADINGWGVPETPSFLTNRSDHEVSFLTLTIPAHGVVVHPSPSRESIVAWRSPLTGMVQITGAVSDADNKCGNGAAWRIEQLTNSGPLLLAQGVIDNGGRQTVQIDQPVSVHTGDVVSFIVNARDNNHVCDTTQVEWTLTEAGDAGRKWDLATEVVDRVLEGNPLADRLGNPDVWHFCATSSAEPVRSLIPPGSALAHWRAAILNHRSDDEIAKLAVGVQAALTSSAETAIKEADQTLQARFTSWTGPLRWFHVAANSLGSSTLSADENASPKPAVFVFGQHPNGTAIDAGSLCVAAPHRLEVSLPAELLQTGAKFVATAELHPETSSSGRAQVQITTSPAELPEFSVSLPVLVGRDEAAHAEVARGWAELRDLFPPALCYSRIVPVDEVVTLTLYFREDHQLQRLMLNEDQVAELDRLWDELFYVAQEPLALTVAFEQIYEFATQDRPDLVEAFGPMRQPINDRADVFRQRLIDSEPAHLEAVVRFADRAWRRPLSEAESHGLQHFYQQLRSSEVAHDEAIRLSIARILATPAFVYRQEQPAVGTKDALVTKEELATRLSYFLWSSLPDPELRSFADSGRLTDTETLLQQTRRMLREERTQRLAVQFACQWLHLRDFDHNDDKNEQLFPEFAARRVDMYEETVRFFDDLFRNDGSILDILNADHTFLNADLAKHYGIPDVNGSEWQRVEGVRQQGRGGVLGMATVLASQSGASRTSPILRGNWIYETLLGERLPRPPANVPQLPEEVPTGLTERQLIERHSSDAACARCHRKIDPYGFALEQYDAIGRLRAEAVDTKTVLESGQAIEGIEGLRLYLAEERQADVVRQFCRKLLGFALGREVQLSDEILLNEMQQKLAAENFRFHVAVESIVTSPQFRKIRGIDSPLNEHSLEGRD